MKIKNPIYTQLKDLVVIRSSIYLSHIYVFSRDWGTPVFRYGKDSLRLVLKKKKEK